MDINAALEQGIIKRTNRAVLVGMHPGITGNLTGISGDLTDITGYLKPEAEVLKEVKP